jgi:hypothetical protein
MAGTVFTNVEQVTHNAVSLGGVTKVSFNEALTFLFSQADGNRQACIAGTLGGIITAIIELEDDGTDRGARLGTAAAGDLVFKVQEGDDSGTFKTWTITDVVLSTHDYSTDQAAPNAVALDGRTTDEDDTASVA